MLDKDLIETMEATDTNAAAAAETVEVLEVLATAEDVKFEEEAETVADNVSKEKVGHSF